MFDIIFAGMEAWNQTGMLVMGLVFLIMGGGIAGYELYWRIKSVGINGRISAVKVVNNSNNKDNKKRNVTTYENDEEEIEGKGKVAGVAFVLLFITVPLLFIGLGVNAIYDYYFLTSAGVYTDAEIVRYKESYDSESGTSYYAILKFRDEQGKSWEVQDSFGSGTPAFNKGEILGIYYDESDPERFVIDDFWHSVGPPMIFAGFGFSFLTIFIVVFVLRNGQRGGNKISTMGEMYYPVYEYQNFNGDRMECVGSVGRNSLLGMIPGSDLRLMMFPKRPEKVRRPVTFFLVFGVIFAIPGVFITYMAFTQYESSPLSVLFMIGVIGFILFRMRKALEEQGLFKLVLDMKNAAGNSGRVLTSEEVSFRVKKQAKQSIIAGYIVLFIAVGLSVGAYFAGLDMLDLISNGQYAQGQVVDIVSRNGSESGYTYHSVIAFKDEHGNTIRFEDSVGYSHPANKRGDGVVVLYNPDESSDMIVDRGFMNWGLSGGLAIGAFFMLLLGLNALRQGRVHGGTRYRDRI